MNDLPLWTEASFVVLDVEGDGGRPADLVELGLVPIEAGGVAGETVSWLVRPRGGIAWQACRVHGISDKDVAGQPPFDDIADQVRAHLNDVVPVGHNVKIDLGVLFRKLPDWRPPIALDTLRLARAAWPTLPSHALGALVDHHDLATGLPDGLRPHRVEWDVLVTARLLGLLVRDLGITTWAELREAGGIDLTPARPESGPELTLFE